MDKQERKQYNLIQRKSALKRIFSLFGRQEKAEELIRSEEKLTPYDVRGLFGKGDSMLTRQYTDYVYNTYLAKMSSKKRIAEYYTMAADPEIQYALTEIVDEMCMETEDGKIFTIKFDSDVKDEVRKIVYEEFKDLIINKLRLGDYNNVWEWAYKWIVQGVVVFKIKFNSEKATGIEELAEMQPWLVSELKREGKSSFYIIKEHENAEEGYKHDPAEIIKVESGHYMDGEYFSILEFAKKDWRRLNLIEDATIIYKLSRSPMRRVFKVFVGKMAPKDIEPFLQEFRSRLREDVSYDPNKGEVLGLNPITLLDDYFFPVLEGGQETCTVDTVQERDINFETQDEIRYFLGKVYRALKIPVGRMNIANQQGEYSVAQTGSKTGEIMRDEIKFSNFVKRLQNRFIEQFIQEIFFRHLFLRGLIDKLDITRSSMRVAFVYRSPYNDLKNAEVEEYRMSSFANINNASDLFSPLFLIKKYLKWTDEEIRQNFETYVIEKQLRAKYGIGAGGEAAEGAPGGAPGGMMGAEMGGAPPLPTGEVGIEGAPPEGGEEAPTLEETPTAETTGEAPPPPPPAG